jgi:hypothetical protein
VNALIFQEPVQNAPGESAVRTASLQRQINAFFREALTGSRFPSLPADGFLGNLFIPDQGISVSLPGLETAS